MKIALLVLSLIFLLRAEEPKQPKEPPTEKILSTQDIFEIRYTIAALNYAGSKKLTQEEYHKEADPLQQEQNAWIIAHCKEVGVAQEKMQSECKWTLGLDQDGKPMNGADGKPMIAKFWKEVPQKEQGAASKEKP